MEGSMGYLDAFAIDWWNTHQLMKMKLMGVVEKERKIVDRIVP
jgi:hypothetical protein